MPKIVDHEERRKHIAEATWRIILNQGMKGASVRNIAKEAGLSLGALRHYFSTQDELLTFAMNLVKERATERIKLIAARDVSPMEKALLVLQELVPVDRHKMAETEVWFAFIFYMKYKHTGSDTEKDGVYDVVKVVVDYLEQQQLLRPGMDVSLETERLYALVDGIALHALFDERRSSRERIICILESHLESICRSEALTHD
ncbi:TetR/AcrR family transcriptional regulator [Marinicrinis lubricantis]|uniref:TetR/AcrR family transcriptional regulator n=1 Tax=Marinicrinis lubricantis TaxID=2086470 RepID=A0ABW1IQ88_9BACL